MLNRIATILCFLLVLFSFPGTLFAQGKSEKPQSTKKCMICHNVKDKSDFIVIDRDHLGLSDSKRFLWICPACQKLPRCMHCHLPLKTRKDSETDLCPTCKVLCTPVIGENEIQKIAEEVKKGLASMFGMNIQHQIRAVIGNVELGALARYEGYNENLEHVIAFSDRKGEMDYIMVFSTIIHELTHVWQKEYIGLEDYEETDNKAVVEGFAVFVQWCYLTSLKNRIPQSDLSIMEGSLNSELRFLEKSHDEIYGDGFRKMKTMMGDTRSAQEWEKKLTEELNRIKLKNHSCAFCQNLAETESACGDPLCLDCSNKSIKNKDEVEKAMKDVRRILSAKFKMTSKHALFYDICMRDEVGFEACDNHLELGLFEANQNKARYTIRVLVVLPPDEFRSAGAHQLAHDWMDENLPHLMDVPEVREGFAEYVAWSLAKAEGSKRMMELIENRTDEVYGGGFRKMRELLKNTKNATEWKTILLKKYPAPNASGSGKAPASSQTAKQTKKSGK